MAQNGFVTGAAPGGRAVSREIMIGPKATAPAWILGADVEEQPDKRPSTVKLHARCPIWPAEMPAAGQLRSASARAERDVGRNFYRLRQEPRRCLQARGGWCGTGLRW